MYMCVYYRKRNDDYVYKRSMTYIDNICTHTHIYIYYRKGNDDYVYKRYMTCIYNICIYKYMYYRKGNNDYVYILQKEK